MIKRTKTNFTLIELLVVMLLMGFLITLMLPGFNRMISEPETGAGTGAVPRDHQPPERRAGTAEQFL